MKRRGKGLYFSSSPLDYPGPILPGRPLNLPTPHPILGVNVCASRDQQRAGLGVAFPSAQVESSALGLDTHQKELEGDSHFR